MSSEGLPWPPYIWSGNVRRKSWKIIKNIHSTTFFNFLKKKISKSWNTIYLFDLFVRHSPTFIVTHFIFEHFCLYFNVNKSNFYHLVGDVLWPNRLVSQQIKNNNPYITNWANPMDCKLFHLRANMNYIYYTQLNTMMESKTNQFVILPESGSCYVWWDAYDAHVYAKYDRA